MMVAVRGDAPVAPEALLESELTTRAMGGDLRVLVASAVDGGGRADRDMRYVAGRIDAWARRLTRFTATSDLGILNAEHLVSPAALRPTLASVLWHSRQMTTVTEGTIDVTLLDARLAAETDSGTVPMGRRPWSFAGHGRQRALVRHGKVRFDLDGVAKGWIADRALRLLDTYPCALIDADGDVAARTTESIDWSIAVAHPDDDDFELARVRLPEGWTTGSFGVATSGTSVHRWHRSDGPTHHLIDPLTGRPAVTDVVQATVVAESTGLAEALAKSAVIRGSQDGLELLGRASAWGALLLLENGGLLASPGTVRWLA